MANELNTEMLIDLVEERPCLWDLCNDDYKNKQKKAKSWAEIGEQLSENFMDQSEKEKNETCKYAKFFYCFFFIYSFCLNFLMLPWKSTLFTDKIRSKGVPYFIGSSPTLNIFS